MKLWIGLGLVTVLAGCGVGTVGTAATQAELAAQEAKQGKQLEQNVQQQLDASKQAGQQRLDDAAKAANN
jgi:hypothetical protein